MPPTQTITLIISSGVETVQIPRVENLDEAIARSQLENAGLSVSTSDQQVDNPGQDGKVLSQSPQGGQANRGDTISLVIGRFREPEIPPDEGNE